MVILKRLPAQGTIGSKEIGVLREALTRNWLRILLLVVLSCAVLLPSLSTTSLWDPDEGRYAVCARTAIREGHWIVPYYNGHPRVVKPPLMVWLVAASSLAFNKGEVTEWTARLPSVLAAVLTVVLTFLIAYILGLEPNASMLAGLILLTSHLFCKQGRFAITDMVLLFFLIASFFCFVMGYGLGRAMPNERWYLGMYLFWGLATMQKGPAVGFVLPVLIIMVFLWSSSELYRVRELISLWGIAIYLLLVLPWPLAVGKDYLKAFLWDNNVKRFASNPEWKSSPFFYISNLPFQFMPWSPFLVLLFGTIRKVKLEFEVKTAFLWCWFGVVFLLFSLSDTKRSSYILPLYPALSILVAWAFQNLEWHERELRPYWKVSLVLLGLSLAGVCGGMVWLWWNRMPVDPLGIALGLFGASLGAPLLLYLLSKERLKPVVGLVFALALGYSLLYTAWYQPTYDRYYRSPKRYIMPMKKLLGSSRLFHLGSIRSHDLFYFERDHIPAWTPKDGVEVLKNSYLLSRGRKVDAFPTEIKAGLNEVIEVKYRGKRMVLLRGDNGV